MPLDFELSNLRTQWTQCSPWVRLTGVSVLSVAMTLAQLVPSRCAIDSMNSWKYLRNYTASHAVLAPVTTGVALVTKLPVGWCLVGQLITGGVLMPLHWYYMGPQRHIH